MYAVDIERSVQLLQPLQAYLVCCPHLVENCALVNYAHTTLHLLATCVKQQNQMYHILCDGNVFLLTEKLLLQPVLPHCHQ